MQKSQSREGTSDAAKETSQSQSLSKASTKGPKVFTTVLFPSPLSMEEEVFLYANTPDPRSNKGKQAQGGGLARTPASATLTHPPTPLSAVSPTPANPPPNKKQKMLVKEGDVRDFHSKLVNSTAGPLYLEPVHSLQEARNLIEILTDDQHKGSYPAPRTRKRTVAELEADEALAASEQRFMLIMDERLASSASGAAGKSNGADGEVGVASFEPSFGRFKAIEAIRLAQQEREQRAQEAKAHETAIKVRQEQAERLKRENDKKMEAISRDVQQQQQQQQKMSLQAFQSNRVHQAANLASLQQQGRMASSQNLHAHGPTSNNIMQNQQNMPPNTQAQHSSPVVRQLTPHSNPRSSPLVGSLPTNHTPHSVPMNVTSSGQGATSSPARPPSAAQHGHPGGAAMVRQRSQQRPPSRMGTPQMPNGTPGMQNVTPVMNHATPNPRMTQTSPPVSMANPSVKHNALGAQHLTNQQMSVAEQNANMLRYRQQLQLQQHQPQLQQHQPQLQTAMMPSAHQMSPNHAPPSTPNLQQLAAQNQQRQYNEYQQQLNNHHRQMNLSNGVSPPHPQPHPGHQPPRPPPGTQQSNAAALRGHYQAQLANQILNKMKQNLVMAHGSPANVPPEKIEEARNRATQMARDQMMRNAQFAQAHQNAQMAHNPQNQQQNILLRQQQQQNQATVFAHMGVNGMGGGINGMNNLNGMNLGGGMNGMGGVNGMGGMGGGGMNGMG